jgi:hypothetical protein
MRCNWWNAKPVEGRPFDVISLHEAPRSVERSTVLPGDTGPPVLDWPPTSSNVPEAAEEEEVPASDAGRATIAAPTMPVGTGRTREVNLLHPGRTGLYIQHSVEFAAMTTKAPCTGSMSRKRGWEGPTKPGETHVLAEPRLGREEGARSPSLPSVVV